MSTLRIATRSSPLALWQANYVKDELLKAHPGLDVELIHVTTGGDRNTLDPLHSFGGMGAFTKEVQLAVLENRADIAVHSLKDLPTETTPGLTISAVPRRAPTADVIVFPSHRADILSDYRSKVEGLSQLSQQDLQEIANGTNSLILNYLPQNAIVGTGSIRRRAQLLNIRPDLDLREIRGNIDTRLKKLEAGDYDAIILAKAGLSRLMPQDLPVLLTLDQMLPAVGQGALGLETRSDDTKAIESLSPLNDLSTQLDVTAERALLRTLRAGCHAPVGVETKHLAGNFWSFFSVILSPDGKERIDSGSIHAAAPKSLSEAEALGIELAQNLIAKGGERLLNLS